MVTGGAGYIGAHIVRVLRHHGHRVAVLDDLTTGQRGRVPADTDFFHGTILDAGYVTSSLIAHRSDAVVHVAGVKSLDDSIRRPLDHYSINAVGTHSVLKAMQAADVHDLVYSSTAAVYAPHPSGVVDEESPTCPTTPYGRSKLMAEQMISDAAHAQDLNWTCLRYFNVAGANEALLADTTSRSLIPSILSALYAGLTPVVYGDDYATTDGTCIRDYIHVGDVAEAHLVVLENMTKNRLSTTYNIGSGGGYTVLNVIEAIRRVVGYEFAIDILGRRPGDLACVVADTAKIRSELGWAPRRDMLEIVESLL